MMATQTDLISGKRLRLPSDTLDSLLWPQAPVKEEGVMPYRPNQKELLELIESVEACGGDATELRRELDALEPEVKRAPQTRRGSRVEEKEETTEERLIRRVGYLFPNNKPPFEKILDYDRRFTLKELREQCREAELSVSGDKKELIAKLVAKGIL